MNLLKSIDRLLTSGIFQGKRKLFVCILKYTYCVFTLWGRDVSRATVQWSKSKSYFREFLCNWVVIPAWSIDTVNKV